MFGVLNVSPPQQAMFPSPTSSLRMKMMLGFSTARGFAAALTGRGAAEGLGEDKVVLDDEQIRRAGSAAVAHFHEDRRWRAGWLGRPRFRDACGLFRFRDLPEAAKYLDAVAADYDHQCGAARALAEKFFDARKVAARLLERALK